MSYVIGKQLTLQALNINLIHPVHHYTSPHHTISAHSINPPTSTTSTSTTSKLQPPNLHTTQPKQQCPLPPPPSPQPAAAAPAAASAQKKPLAPAASNPPSTAPAKKRPPKTKSRVHAAAATNALPVHALARVRVKKTQSLRVALVLVARDRRVSEENIERGEGGVRD
jgi:hypothetical protein